jgi:Holliday junction resolvasome RuvABC DNA-binding subunit
MEIISQKEKINDIADNIVLRTYEIYFYDQNINNYLMILENSEKEWPEKLLHLRTVPPHDAVSVCDESDIELLSELQNSDRISYLIKTERLEKSKSEKILSVLKMQFDELVTEEDQQTIIDEAVARRNAQVYGPA